MFFNLKKIARLAAMFKVFNKKGLISLKLISDTVISSNSPIITTNKHQNFN